MERIGIGDIHIQRIMELEEPFIPVSKMFPDANAQAIAPHRSWLEPWALCPVSGRLILPVQSYLLKTSRHTILIDTCVGISQTGFLSPGTIAEATSGHEDWPPPASG